MKWKKIKIAEEDVLITNITMEKGNKGLRFLIYGISKQQGSYGFQVPQDFSMLMPRYCKHWENVDMSDYEIWTPVNQNNTCQMGKKTSYQRRKPNAECFNPDEFNLANKPEICQCSIDDYECDVGFIRTEEGICILPEMKEIDFSPPSQCSGVYIVKKGYRKVAGNQCSLI